MPPRIRYPNIHQIVGNMQGDSELEGIQIANMDTAKDLKSKSTRKREGTMKEGITILQPRIALFHAKPNRFRIPFLLGGSAPSSTVAPLCLADSPPLISLIFVFVAFSLLGAISLIISLTSPSPISRSGPCPESGLHGRRPGPLNFIRRP